MYIMKKRKKLSINNLFNFSLVKWIEDQDIRDEKILKAGLYLKKIKRHEEDFTFKHNKNFRSKTYKYYKLINIIFIY